MNELKDRRMVVAAIGVFYGFMLIALWSCLLVLTGLLVAWARQAVVTPLLAASTESLGSWVSAVVTLTLLIASVVLLALPAPHRPGGHNHQPTAP